MNPAYRLILVMCFVLAGAFFSGNAYAQCPMCKIGAESNLKNGGTAGKGLNNGILYMLALPYTVVATLGFVWWRNNRRREEDELEVLP